MVKTLINQNCIGRVVACWTSSNLFLIFLKMDVSTLQLGDFVIKKEGLSKRKICKVVQIHAKSLCVKSIDGEPILNEPSFLAFIDAFEPISLTGSFLELNGFIPQTSAYARRLFEDGITSIDDVWTLWRNIDILPRINSWDS
jgi:hypothetical protein